MTTVRAQPQDKSTIVAEENHTCPGQIDEWGIGKNQHGVRSWSVHVGVSTQVQYLFKHLITEICRQS